MNLEEFITLSLVQIAKGVEGAAKQLADSSCKISPRRISPDFKVDSKFYGYLDESESDHPRHMRIVEAVEFDVSVSVAEGSDKKGGLRVGISSIGIGKEGGTHSSSTSDSRIRFRIPIVLPNSPG